MRNSGAALELQRGTTMYPGLTLDQGTRDSKKRRAQEGTEEGFNDCPEGFFGKRRPAS